MELPLTFTVTPANVYDSVEYPNLLQKLLSKGIKPDVIIADAGYDSKKELSYHVGRRHHPNNRT